MAFVDQITLHLKAGKGGAGAVSFRREKYTPKGGPDGGDGGDGGSIVFRTSSRLHSLIDLKTTRRKYAAKNGAAGTGKKQHGSKGTDLIIDIPTGTLVFDDNRELIADLSDDNTDYVIVKGGKGGRGNPHFSTSINRVPTYAQPGLPGEEQTVHLELRILAEVGLVGLPNAGKSSLLHCITRANPKVDAYPFTTLFPNLGTLKTIDREVILADIPGLIEGASKGQGLGHDFLRHIDRTSLIIHLVGAEEDAKTCWSHYETILNELDSSPYAILEKPQIVILSKVDTVSPEKTKEIVDFFAKKKLSVIPVSSFTNEGISSLIESILKNVTAL